MDPGKNRNTLFIFFQFLYRLAQIGKITPKIIAKFDMQASNHCLDPGDLNKVINRHVNVMQHKNIYWIYASTGGAHLLFLYFLGGFYEDSFIRK
jgi:hypothetical protein